LVTTTPGTKLVGSGAITAQAEQGCAVALNSNGKTLVVGSGNYRHNYGVWVFAYNGTAWTQEGENLAASGVDIGNAVAITDDGNMVAAGARLFDGGFGGVFVFTRVSGKWIALGSRILGTGAIGWSEQGTSVALSGDGQTLAVGGPVDYFYNGATWLFFRDDLNSSTWREQGKLTSSNAIRTTDLGFYDVNQGCSVALSSDGQILAMGGNDDNNYRGAVFMYSWNTPTSAPSSSPTTRKITLSTHVPTSATPPCCNCSRIIGRLVYFITFLFLIFFIV
jgi:hypothetical protein